LNSLFLLAGELSDLFSFDPATMAWTLLSAADDARRPSARDNHGFTSAGGLLYVHGGWNIWGNADFCFYFSQSWYFFSSFFSM
jgi:hypothetical protein